MIYPCRRVTGWKSGPDAMSTLPPTLQQIDRTYVLAAGRRLSYFAGCDYFRQSSHPRIVHAVHTGLDKFGLSVSASRLTTGNHPLYTELENSVAKFFTAPTATLCSIGYTPNIIVAQALAGSFTHALMDERSHGSLIDAAQFLDCPIVKFRHRDPANLAEKLRRLPGCHPLIMTDGMFSHDGSAAPLREYLELLPAEGMILLDDAHAAGLLGAHGRGTLEHANVPRARIIQSITLSKAFGVYGGMILGDRKVRAAILARSRMFIGNTPLPLPLAQAALTSVRQLAAHPAPRQRLMKLAGQVKERLRQVGFPLPNHPGPIIPVIPKSSRETNRWKRALLAADILPPFIHYLGGPAEGYFRFVLSSEHPAEQIDNLVAVFAAQTRG